MQQGAIAPSDRRSSAAKGDPAQADKIGSAGSSTSTREVESLPATWVGSAAITPLKYQADISLYIS